MLEETMKEPHTTTIGRRPVLKGAGLALAGLGGLTGSAVAEKGGNGKGGKTPLTDRQADVLVYASTDGSDFGYPTAPFFGGNDPAGGGFFDFGKIEMTPNGGTLHNSFELFAGALLASKPKPYVLVHLGDGLYESGGQVMRFEAKPIDQIIFPVPPASLPPIATLAGETWRAVATERAQLGLDADGQPDPTMPEWGVTRVDFYEGDTNDYALSLLYLIGADTTERPDDGIPLAAHIFAGELMAGGRLNPGGK